MPTQNVRQLSPQEAAMLAAAAQAKQNREFMALSVNKEVLCQQANGGANQQPFTAGQPLTFNVTTANNAYLTGFWIRAALTVTLAAGASAVYQLNAAAPLSVVDTVVVNYGGNQHNFRLYMLKYISQFRGSTMQIQPRSIVAGITNATVQAYYASTTPIVAGSGNTWNLAIYMPMNLIHPQDPRGIIPIQGGENTCQVVLNCAGAPFGNDPVLNTLSAVSGTGHAVTITGNLSVIACYKDGLTPTQLTALQPNLSGLESVQFQKDTPLFNLGAGQVYRGRISFLQKMPWVFCTVIDGNQPTKFSALSNIQLIETTADATGNRPFWRYGLNTNLDVRGYFDDLSGKMGGLLQQDFDEGFFPLIWGPIAEQSDAGIYEGKQYLNMTSESGWTDYHYGFQLSSVGGLAGIQPRIEPHVIALNAPLVM